MKKVLVILIVGVMLISGCGCDKKSDLKPVTNEKPEGEIIDGTEIEDIIISNMSILREEEETKLFFTITNNTEEHQDIKNIIIRFEDNSGEKREYRAYVLNGLKGKETRNIRLTVSEDIRDSAEVEYEIER